MIIIDFIKTDHAELGGRVPWEATAQSESIVAKLVANAGRGFTLKDGNAIHESAIIEQGAIIKSPAYIGPRCFIAAGAYLRGGVWLEQDVIIGPACEIKSSYIFRGSKTAHLSFVGDSVIGIDVNIEAGAMIANYRNERADKAIWFRYKNKIHKTGVYKFGAVVGDHTRIGANAVIAPGAALTPGTIVKRLQLLDQA
jgi:UDP-N-acetylglucosamine diphosphorylase / glucose-1-phosphate thymidylyltransferase / UDP-N-acetylgalactosamine diphosphorylase / glucosamine-1-phosphate N-acetyltransferase / galactosamine-1-phosphate N-acetyltransferase